MQIEISTGKSTILLVKLPINYDHSIIDEDNLMIGTFRDIDGVTKKHYEELPEGKWQIVSKLSDITSEQAREMVETAKPTYFKDYCIATRFYSSPTQSLNSLIRSIGGDTNNEYLVLKEG